MTRYIDNGSNAQRFVADLIDAAETEMQSWSGLRGRTARLGYSACQRFRPSFIDDNIDRMLPELARVLDPHVREGIRQRAITQVLVSRNQEIIDGVLSIIDRAAAATGNAPVRALYSRLRPSGSDYLSLLVPAIAPVVQSHLADDVASEHPGL